MRMFLASAGGAGLGIYSSSGLWKKMMKIFLAGGAAYRDLLFRERERESKHGRYP